MEFKYSIFRTLIECKEKIKESRMKYFLYKKTYNEHKEKFYRFFNTSKSIEFKIQGLDAPVLIIDGQEIKRINNILIDMGVEHTKIIVEYDTEEGEEKTAFFYANTDMGFDNMDVFIKSDKGEVID